jgi:spore germination protein GerM
MGKKREFSMKTPLILIGLVAVGLIYWLTNFSQDRTPIVEQPDRPPVSTPEVLRVKVYYANKDYIQTGQDNLPRVLAVEKTLPLETSLLEQAEEVVAMLQQNPEDIQMSNALREDMQIEGVQVREKIAYVNFKEENLFGGSLEESLIIQQLVMSLTSLEGIDSVQILVNNEVRDTLLGHMSIEEPIAPESFAALE